MTITIARLSLMIETARGRVQLHLGRGSTGRRLIWWPDHGQIGLRTIGSWWAGLNWWPGRPA